MVQSQFNVFLPLNMILPSHSFSYGLQFWHILKKKNENLNEARVLVYTHTHTTDTQTHNSCCRVMTLALNGKNCLNIIKRKRNSISSVKEVPENFATSHIILIQLFFYRLNGPQIIFTCKNGVQK